MKPLLRLATAGLLALQLVACGGGDANPVEPMKAQARAQATAQTTLAAPTTILDVTQLLDWAEREYPQFFPSHQANLESAPYTYRYYPETGNYVGVAGQDVYILGPFSGNVITRVGSREDYRCSVIPADCPVPGYARAGWVANLSTLQHGVSGNVTIVDARTVRITEFNYDGGGPQVYAYLGADNSNAAFQAGRVIGAQLNRAGPAYVNATLDLQLPAGQTLDGFNALSIWCAEFRVNFGSGGFKAPPTPTAVQ